MTGTVDGRRLGCGWHLTKSLRSRETIGYHPNWDVFRVTFCTGKMNTGMVPGMQDPWSHQLLNT